MVLHILFDNNSSWNHGLRVARLSDEQGTDYTFLLDFDKVYLSLADIRQELAAKLEVDLAAIELEEV